MSGQDDDMAEPSDALTKFNDAAIEWAAGGSGQALVDAAVEALVDDLDSKHLRGRRWRPVALPTKRRPNLPRGCLRSWA